MKNRLIVGNWKSYPASLSEAKKIFEGIKKRISKIKGIHCKIAVPYTFVHPLTKGKKGGRLQTGVQDVSPAQGGPHTGDVAASMAASVGATFAIVGHSERRAQGDTDQIVNKKLLAALGAGLDVVLCIGETERDIEGGYFAYIRTELDVALQGVLPRDLSKIIIAYEPIFAIGKSAAEAMSGAEVQEMVIFIRKLYTERYNRSRADAVSILYGGSVDDSNARSIYIEGAVDGFLLGRASLDAKIIERIVQHTK